MAVLVEELGISLMSRDLLEEKPEPPTVTQLVSGCWVGGEDRDIHFDSMALGQGASMALPIWAYYMKKVYRNKDLGYSPDVDFDIPENFNSCVKEVDETGSNDIEEVFE